MASIFDLSRDELAAQLAEWGEPAYRAAQVWEWLYVQLADSPAKMKNLSKALREKLAGEYTFGSLTRVAEKKSSDGGTRKWLFDLPDGKQVEAVLMSYERRQTACISTQAGCAMGCVFCATGQMGFERHLTAGEIVEQVLWIEREMRRDAEARQAVETRHPTPLRFGDRGGASPHRVTNIVVMGMGEPFHNYEATLQAVDRLGDEKGFHFGARRFTISTVGLAPAIDRFTQERRQVNLAVSLHAATDDVRTRLLPVNKRYPLPVLMAACRRYVETTRRRLTFEWALIQGVNDTPEQARALGRLLEPLRPLVHVNAIPLNPTHDYAGAASTRERAADFKAVLEEAGIPCTVRVRRGIDIQAGCGQLRTASGEGA